jgi:hypothetical protein
MNKINSIEQNIFSLLGDPKTSLRLKSAIIKNLDQAHIDKICELILNILNKNIPLSKEAYDNLRPKAKYLRQILCKNKSLKEKKKILIKKGIQKGGLLQFILPFALSFLGGLLKDWVSSKIAPQNQNEASQKMDGSTI